MKKKQFLIGTGIAAGCAAVIGAVSHTVTRTLVDVALRRDMRMRPIGGKRRSLSGSTVSDDVRRAAEEAADRLANTPHERVEITSRDGLTLVGHWFPCAQARRTILAMHGWRSRWAYDFSGIAGFLHSHDCNVLYVEQRAQGDSEGEYMGFGLLERYDCADWAAWIDRQTDGTLPIYLTGISMGATTVLLATELPLPQRVRGVMADCGFDSVHNIWKHVAEQNLHLHYTGPRKAAVEALCRRRLQMRPSEVSTEEALRKNSSIPVLFVHGTGDRFVPVEMTYANYQACAAPKELFIVPGAGHGMSYLADRAGYEERLYRFWKRCEECEV